MHFLLLFYKFDVCTSAALSPNSNRHLIRPERSSSSSSLLLSNSIPRNGELSSTSATGTGANDVQAEAEVDRLVIIEQCRMLKQVRPPPLFLIHLLTHASSSCATPNRGRHRYPNAPRGATTRISWKVLSVNTRLRWLNCRRLTNARCFCRLEWATYRRSYRHAHVTRAAHGPPLIMCRLLQKKRPC